MRKIGAFPITVAVAFAFALLLAVPAYASTRDDLNYNYQSAKVFYEGAKDEQGKNAEEIKKTEKEIAGTEDAIDRSRAQLDETAITVYKGTRGRDVIVDLILNASSFQDAVARYDAYEKIENYYYDRIGELSIELDDLNEQKVELEEQKAEIEAKVEEARIAAEAAALALLDNTHTDGAKYHQRQGVSNNCGATAFIVGVNTILHENRYVDNVAVWEGPGFEGDSTSDLAYRGGTWLVANGLADIISIGLVPGDVHTVDDMRYLLEEGYVVIASSGSGSTFQRAGAGEAPKGSFPDGHWVCFYCYDNGIFYANDSAVEADEGAGCVYTEGEMQEWLDGRENHFATTLKKK